MAKNIIDVLKWLDTPCKPSELSENDDEKKSKYLPIDIVEEKLMQLSGNIGYQTKDFKFQINAVQQTVFVSASLELSVSYKVPNNEIIYRTLVGAVTFKASDYKDNDNWAATAKSECIKNAAKGLGKQFGSHLNDRQDKKISKKEAAKIRIDKVNEMMLAQLSLLAKTKGTLLSEDLKENINRIISNKEVFSYPKLLRLLTDLQ